MIRTLELALAGLALSLVLGTAAVADEPKTLFDYIETSYVFGEVVVAKPMPYREGALLLYTTKVTDLVHARVGKPQQLMLVVELRNKDEKPPWEGNDRFVAPIALLPDYSYWRDNLPTTPHHQVMGGTRYVFRGDQIEEAKRIARPFAATLQDRSAEKWPHQADAVVTGLKSSLQVISEDSSRYLASHPALLQRMSDETKPRLAAYLASDAKEPDRIRVIDAIGGAHAENLSDVLAPLETRDDTTGAAALRASAAVGKSLDTAKLNELTDAKNEAVRAFAVQALGERAAQDQEAFSKATAVLNSNAPSWLRSSAAVGLGHSRAKAAVPALETAFNKGDEVSRSAAAAMAEIGGPEVADMFKKAITSSSGETQASAILAMMDLREGCSDCGQFLEQQYQENPDKNVRNLIGIMLEKNKKHEH